MQEIWEVDLQMIDKTYEKYLKSKHWRIKRKEALEFYFHMCMMCGRKATQIHHLSYKDLLLVQITFEMKIFF